MWVDNERMPKILKIYKIMNYNKLNLSEKGSLKLFKIVTGLYLVLIIMLFLNMCLLS